MIAVTIASLVLAQVPAKDPRAAAAEKQAAFIAQVTATALNQDIGLLQRLDTPFPKPVHFEDAPAGEVMKAIRAAAKSTIEFDPRAVGESGGWEATRVTCDPATVRQALDALLRAISPEYEQYVVDVAAGIIVVTDEKGQRTLRTSAPYPLDATFTRMGVQDGDAAAFERTRRELEDFFMITQHGAWEANGGDIARVVWTGGVATVEATPSMHLDIRRRLAQLEEQLPSATLEWSFSIATLSDKATRESLDAAIGTREGVEKLVKDGTATVLAAPRLIASAIESAEIAIGSDSDSITVRVEPTPARTGRVFVLRIQVKQGNASGSLALRAIPGVRAAAVLEVGGRSLLIEGLGLTEAMQKFRK
jgi:hypothetical protein